LVLMPTGAGKSLCYQIPALLRQGTGVVVSPLIALMQDQVDAMCELGVRAGFLNSTQDPGARLQVETAFVAGELDLLYLAPERLRQLLELLRTEHDGDAGIVYCLTRASVEQTAEFLTGNGITALPYHAGLDARTRTANQARFLREDGMAMVATIAFGMGIDKPDVRYVAHLDLPKSVEGYYQETGRAGRDGLAATAWLAYGLADVVQQRKLIDTSEGG